MVAPALGAAERCQAPYPALPQALGDCTPTAEDGHFAFGCSRMRMRLFRESSGFLLEERRNTQDISLKAIMVHQYHLAESDTMISFGRSLVVAVFSAVAEYIACPCTTRRASTLAWACKASLHKHFNPNPPLAFCE